MPIFSIPGNVTPGGLVLATDITTLYNAINGQLDFQNIATSGIQNVNILAGTIAVGKLKTSSSGFGVQQAATKHFGGAYFVLSSGSFSFYPGLSTDAAAGTIGSIGGNVSVDTVADFDVANKGGIARQQANATTNAILWLAVLNATNVGTNQAFTVAQFVSTSPPYDLGDGEVYGFLYALIDPDGTVRATAVGEDPPWNHVKTPKLKTTMRLEEAKKSPATMAKHLEEIDDLMLQSDNMKKLMDSRSKSTDQSHRDAMSVDINRLASSIYDPASLIPPTPAEKNEHMAETPHPFADGHTYPGATPVLLDPMSKETRQLLALRESGENINQLIHDGYVSIDNTPAKSKGPPGVMVVSHRMKGAA